MGHDSFRWILDALPAGVWVATAPDGRVAYSNEKFDEILGFRAVAESLISDAPSTYGIFDRAGLPFPVERLPFSRALATGESVTVDDIVIHRPDGRRVNVRAFGNPVRSSDGTITHVIVGFVDITREVQAEVERTSAEGLLRFAVEHAPIAIFSIDRHGIITLSEGAGLKALGVKSGELVGRSVFDLYKDHPTIPDYIRRGLAGDSFGYTVEVGAAVYDTWLTPLRDAGGAVVGVLGLSNDTSETRRLQASIIQNDRVRALGTLAASVAHEINNPLMFVLGCLGALEQTVAQQMSAFEGPVSPAAFAAAFSAASRMRTEIDTVRKGVERIALIARDLKTFSRADDVAPVPVDLRAVIESALQLVRKEIEARACLRLSVVEVPPVLASEARLVQVLVNLLLNAVQSLGQGGSGAEVSLALRTDGGRVVVEVGDTGPGVPAVERERIFEPFVTTKANGEGTGLGLFVCRNIVRGLGGEVSVHDRPGGGVLFRVSLPSAPQAVATITAPSPATTAGVSEGRILVIDDEVLVARQMAAALEEQGFSPEIATDSRQALQVLLAERAFDLIYCDVMMKGMSGMDIASALEARAPHRLAQMVFMTGGAFVPQATDFMATRRDQCVEKPFDVVEETRRRLSPMPRG